jgi:hypothetical protein
MEITQDQGPCLPKNISEQSCSVKKTLKINTTVLIIFFLQKFRSLVFCGIKYCYKNFQRIHWRLVARALLA